MNTNMIAISIVAMVKSWKLWISEYETEQKCLELSKNKVWEMEHTDFAKNQANDKNFGFSQACNSENVREYSLFSLRRNLREPPYKIKLWAREAKIWVF